jgi:hypothetical protein
MNIKTTTGIPQEKRLFEVNVRRLDDTNKMNLKN